MKSFNYNGERSIVESHYAVSGNVLIAVIQLAAAVPALAKVILNS
jgi:hypothetical protein